MRRKFTKAKAMPVRETALRVVISLFVMLAFGLQSYIAQTHIHLAPDTFESYAKLSQQTGKDQQDKFPSNGDPANCPICQEIAHTGQFVTPTAAVLFPPTASVSIITLVADVAAVPERASHAWQSRAPPRD